MWTQIEPSGRTMCDFRINPPMLFSAPPLQAQVPTRFMFAEASVELFVPDLESFAVSDADLPRIREALREAQQTEASGVTAHC